jgi:hypothetical protein
VGPEADDVVSELARTLGCLGGLRVDLDKARPFKGELKHLRTRIERSGAPARRLLARVEQALGDADTERGPVLRHLSLRRLLWTGSRIAIDGIDDVVLSHPFVDAADFLGRLALAALERPEGSSFGGLAERFRGVYLAEVGGRPEILARFEAAALLRLACAEAERGTGAGVADDLLEAAASRLASGGVERSR